jgi:hypothetical protein
MVKRLLERLVLILLPLLLVLFEIVIALWRPFVRCCYNNTLLCCLVRFLPQAAHQNNAVVIVIVACVVFCGVGESRYVGKIRDF